MNGNVLSALADRFSGDNAARVGSFLEANGIPTNRCRALVTTKQASHEPDCTEAGAKEIPWQLCALGNGIHLEYVPCWIASTFLTRHFLILRYAYYETKLPDF